MNSKVINLADPATMVVDASYRDLTVEENEVTEALETLSGNHGTLCQVEKVQGICCVSVEDAQAREILLYPGLMLPGAEAAEAAVAGKVVGDLVTTTLCGCEVTLQVKKILVNQPLPLDDSLGKACGYATLQELKDSIHAELVEKKRTGNEKALTGAFMDYLVAASQCEIDAEEQELWAMKNARASMAENMAMGLDLGLPEEEAASEEDMLQMMVEDFKQQFIQTLVVRAFCEKEGYEPDPQTLMGGMFIPEGMELDTAMLPEGVELDTTFLPEGMEIDTSMLPEGVELDTAMLQEGMELDTSFMPEGVEPGMGMEMDDAMMEIMLDNERTMYVYDKLSNLAKEVLA